MIPSYVWVTLSVVAGIIILYFICLKLAANDWIGNVPPGPTRLPFIGCLLRLFKISNISEAYERIFTVFGNVVNYTVFRKTMVLTRDTQCLLSPLDEGRMEETTHLYVINLIRSLGFPISSSKKYLQSCFEVGRLTYNYKIPIDDFRLLMESTEKYQSVLHAQKVENLVFTLINEKITLDTDDKKTLQECSTEMKTLKTSIETSPQMFLPFAKYWPAFIMKRKRVYKSVLKIQKILRGLFDKKMSTNSDIVVFNQFFVLYVLMALSKTSPKRRKSAKQKVNLDVFPDSISPIAKDDYEFSFDVCGLRFFKVLDYIKVLGYDT